MMFYKCDLRLTPQTIALMKEQSEKNGGETVISRLDADTEQIVDYDADNNEIGILIVYFPGVTHHCTYSISTGYLKLSYSYTRYFGPVYSETEYDDNGNLTRRIVYTRDDYLDRLTAVLKERYGKGLFDGSSLVFLQKYQGQDVLVVVFSRDENGVVSYYRPGAKGVLLNRQTFEEVLVGDADNVVTDSLNSLTRLVFFVDGQEIGLEDVIDPTPLEQMSSK